MVNSVISLKKSATPGSVPSDLANGELALNFTDGLLFYKAANGTIYKINHRIDSFGTVNANGTLVIADTPGSIITILPGDATLNIVGDATNDRIYVSANLRFAQDTANGAYDKANAANIKADSTWTYAANDAMRAANSAYGAANTTWTYAANNVMLAANTAYGAANTTWTYAANSVMGMANAAYTFAANLAMKTANSSYALGNTTWTFAANNAFLVGNSAYGAANTTWTYAANTVMLAANSAFAMANAANLMPVGNTMANGYWTIRSTRRRINFIPGSLITINVNDDPTLNTANVIVDAAAANPQYAFAKANLAYTYAANDAMLAANSAYAAQNTTYTFAANTVRLIANSAYAAQNTTYTYAANVVMSAANAAFSQANGANLMPVGNTMSNSYWTIRSTRRRINFIPGTNVTINVDDDPTLNTANITINASVTGGGDPQYAFERANIANLQPVGNTMSNGYFTVRSTANKINFVPGTNITVNVDNDATLNTSNITVSANLTVRSANIVNVTVSATEPTNNVAGDLWVDIS